jgi:hypothetical protein
VITPQPRHDKWRTFNNMHQNKKPRISAGYDLNKNKSKSKFNKKAAHGNTRPTLLKNKTF